MIFLVVQEHFRHREFYNSILKTKIQNDEKKYYPWRGHIGIGRRGM